MRAEENAPHTSSTGLRIGLTVFFGPEEWSHLISPRIKIQQSIIKRFSLPLTKRKNIFFFSRESKKKKVNLQ